MSSSCFCSHVKRLAQVQAGLWHLQALAWPKNGDMAAYLYIL